MSSILENAKVSSGRLNKTMSTIHFSFSSEISSSSNAIARSMTISRLAKFKMPFFSRKTSRFWQSISSFACSSQQKIRKLGVVEVASGRCKLKDSNQLKALRHFRLLKTRLQKLGMDRIAIDKIIKRFVVHVVFKQINKYIKNIFFHSHFGVIRIYAAARCG